MTRLLLAACAIALLGTTGCDTYSFPSKPDNEEQMKQNTRVYGDVGGPAKQSLNKYEADPDAAVKSADLRNKLIAEAEGMDAPKALDTNAAKKTVQE